MENRLFTETLRFNKVEFGESAYKTSPAPGYSVFRI